MKLYLFSIKNLPIIISTFMVILCSSSCLASDEDSTAVLAQVEKYQSVWNTHDATALALFFTKYADFIMGNQPLISGKDGIQNWWQIYFNRQEPERKLTIDINSLRIIPPNVAMINVETTTSGKDNQGKVLPTRKARGTWVMIKQNGNWLIIAMRGMPTEEDQIIRSIDNPKIKVDGTFKPIGPPFETPLKIDLRGNCIVEIKQQYNISGTLSGSLEIDYRILVYGPCDEPPGTYDEEWIAFGSFGGTVDSTTTAGKFTYTAKVKAGGDVEGAIVFGQGIDGELTVKGNFKDGKLSYNGHLNEY